MPVDIKLLGTSNQWKLEGPRIRIGRDPGCDVPLSPERFPMVSREHLVLVIEKGHVRFTDPGSANGTYVNGVRAAQGRLLNADRIRLGSDGPELEISIVDETTGQYAQQSGATGATVVSTPVSLGTPTMASTAEAATTMMLGTDGSLQKNVAAAQAAVPPAPAAAPPLPSTAVAPPAAQPTAVAAPPPLPPTAVAPPPQQATVASVPAKSVGATQVAAPGYEPTRVAPAASPSTVYTPDAGASASAPQRTVVQQTGMQAPPQQPQQKVAEEAYPNNESGMTKEQEEMIDQKVGSLQKLVGVLAVMVIVLLGVCFYLLQQIQKTHDAVNDLTRRSENAVAQLQPQVDSRMKALDQKIDAFDGKINEAQDQMVQRLNKELPKTLDAYFDRKMKELQRSGQLPQ